nr:DNA adenine methylase [Rhizobium sp. BK275]
MDWSKGTPAVIYADPPYTNDQYSRYYHLFETAILYDYPLAEGKGLYRGGRFQSSFSLNRQVESSFERMISAAGKSGASLMISYPSNGLLPNSLQKIPEMMAEHFKIVLDPLVIPHKHSTLGGSKGREKEDVEECIFLAIQKPLAADSLSDLKHS